MVFVFVASREIGAYVFCFYRGLCFYGFCGLDGITGLGVYVSFVFAISRDIRASVSCFYGLQGTWADVCCFHKGLCF